MRMRLLVLGVCLAGLWGSALGCIVPPPIEVVPPVVGTPGFPEPPPPDSGGPGPSQPPPPDAPESPVVLVCAAPLRCAPGLTLCQQPFTSPSQECTDLSRSARHCGACGNTCGYGQSCVQGTCQADGPACRRTEECPQGTFCNGAVCRPGCRTSGDCPEGGTCHVSAGICSCPYNTRLCSNRCVGWEDPASCGEQCEACTAPPNGAPLCVDGRCDFSCAPGFRLCGTGCVPGDQAPPARAPLPWLGGFIPAFRMADVNKDGRADLLALVNPDSYSGSLKVLLGQGDGTFSAPQVYAWTDRPGFQFTVGDLDSDGWDDVVVGHGYNGGLTLMLNQKDGTFRASTEPPIQLGGRPAGVTLQDMDGDGDKDLVIPGGEGPGAGLTFAPGLGGGRFGPSRRIVTDCPDSDSYMMEAMRALPGDFDRDGRLDLLVGHNGPHTTLLRGTAEHGFEPPQCYARAGGVQTVVDVDGDGDLDAVTVEGLLRNDGHGTFLQTDPGFSRGFATVGDFDRDGHLDVANMPLGVRRVEVRLGRGSGAFAPPHYQSFEPLVHAMEHADLDGDGKAELLLLDRDSRIHILPLLCR